MRILLFGANSPLGKSITKWLEPNNALIKIVTPWSYAAAYHGDCDCTNIDDIYYQLRTWRPEAVISLVGFNGNLELNKNRPADIAGVTAFCNLNIIQACTQEKTSKVLIPLSSCSYGEQDILKEEDYLKYPVNPSVEAHGYTRRYIYIFGKQYNKQYGNRFIFPIINNCFGINDYWHKPKKLKVFGTLIKKIVEAKLQDLSKVVIWGTGNARREGCDFDEAGRIISKMIFDYVDYESPMNIGYGEDISIKELVNLIKDTVSWEGKIEWDITKPEGQMKKLLDVSKSKRLGFGVQSNLKDDLVKLIKWYEENHGKLSS